MDGNGRVVVVTGGTAGIGRACAVGFAAKGYRVGVLARGQDGLDATVKEIESLGGEAVGVRADVADYDDVEAAAEEFERALGPIEVWVNNAFTGVLAPFTQTTPDEVRRVTEVTYLGYVNGTYAALTRMRDRGRGTIVQVGSALAYRGIPLQSAYCGAKHAIQGFTESLRCELLHDRSPVQVTTVQLPAVNTPQFDWVLSKLPKHPQPVPPIYQPEVAAQAILFAAEHPERREYWVGAPTVGTMIANAVVPGLLDRYLAKTGYTSQQTDEPVSAERPANLWEPVPGDHGSHGSFDDRAKDFSLQLWLAQNPVRVVTGIAAAGLGLVAGWLNVRDGD